MSCFFIARQGSRSPPLVHERELLFTQLVHITELSQRNICLVIREEKSLQMYLVDSALRLIELLHQQVNRLNFQQGQLYLQFANYLIDSPTVLLNQRLRQEA